MLASNHGTHIPRRANTARFPQELGEMAETALYAHLQVRLGLDMSEAEDALSELENASVTIYSEDGQIRLEIQCLNVTAGK